MTVPPTVLVIDGANVVGSRPDGWWRDRPGAAARLHARLAASSIGYDEVILVLEGQARAGAPPGTAGYVTTVHAEREGDSAILHHAINAVARGEQVTVATADRALSRAVEETGASILRPGQLLDLLIQAEGLSGGPGAGGPSRS